MEAHTRNGDFLCKKGELLKAIEAIDLTILFTGQLYWPSDNKKFLIYWTSTLLKTFLKISAASSLVSNYF